MDLCGRRWRRVVPEVGDKRASPPYLSRVNGWSRPLHSFQAAAWVTLLIMAIANFGIFIPFLPCTWRYLAYSMTGGLFFLHFLVHLVAVSIDPAEPSVRFKDYSKPMPTLDRSRHAHVIQDQYCHLCEVTVSSKAKHCSACNKCVSGFDHHCKWLNNCVGTRNYWFFFFSVVSAAAGLLCLVAILVYVSIQLFLNPAELRTHPCYQKVPDKNTWLLFVPLFPVKTETPVVLGIGAFVLLLDVVGLVLLGHLLVFHLYLMTKKLSTFDYMTQNRQQQAPKARAQKSKLSFPTGFPQPADDQSSSAHREKHKEPQPPQKCPSPCSTTAVRPESPLMLQQADGAQRSPTQRGTSKEPVLPDAPSHQVSVTIFPENSRLTETDSKLKSPALGTRRKVLLSPSGSSDLSSTTTTTGPKVVLSVSGSSDGSSATTTTTTGPKVVLSPSGSSDGSYATTTTTTSPKVGQSPSGSSDVSSAATTTGPKVVQSPSGSSDVSSAATTTGPKVVQSPSGSSDVSSAATTTGPKVVQSPSGSSDVSSAATTTGPKVVQSPSGSSDGSSAATTTGPKVVQSPSGSSDVSSAATTTGPKVVLSPSGSSDGSSAATTTGPKVVQSLSGSSDVSSATTTTGPESTVSLKVSEDPLPGEGALEPVQDPMLAEGPTQQVPFGIPVWESDPQNLVLPSSLPQGSACPGSPPTYGAAAAMPTNEPGAEQAVQGRCHLQGGQCPEVVLEMEEAIATPPSPSEGLSTAQGEAGAPCAQPTQQVPFGIPVWESDPQNLVLPSSLPQGSACPGSPPTYGAAAVMPTNEPGAEQAVQGRCHLQGGQCPEVVLEMEEAIATPPSPSEGLSTAQGEAGAPCAQPTQQVPFGIPVWESDPQNLVLPSSLPQGSACPGSPPTYGAAAVMPTNEPGAEQAVQGRCHLQGGQCPEVVLEMEEAIATPPSPSEGLSTAQGEAGAPCAQPREAQDLDV